MGAPSDTVEKVIVSHPLADLLSNSLILQQTAPYLPISSIFALAATCKSLHHIVYNYPEAFRYVDLSILKRLDSDSSFGHPVVLGRDGQDWAFSADDLADDEISAATLKCVFRKLQRRNLLQHVRTLILDGLDVSADLVHEIITDKRFNIHLLSIRECRNINERKLMQVLNYAVRPSRPAGTPRIKGIYIFGPREQPSKQHRAVRPGSAASTNSTRSLEETNALLSRTGDRWYQCSGRMFDKTPQAFREWPETIQACEGIIAFDAVLCRGPRHSPTNPETYLPPAVATVALGPAGCDSCHSSPERPARFGQSPVSQLPLLSPVPRHVSTLRAAQMPHTVPGSAPAPLFARCVECLKGRWCERCHKWWDEECYTASAVAQRTELHQTEVVEYRESGGGVNLVCKEIRKIIGVRRECFGCGHTCISCKEITIRKCVNCSNEYCLEDNEQSSATRCDWCNYTGRRSRELY